MSAPVLVVEGPGCAQVAALTLPEYEVRAWGDLSELDGRDVHLWATDPQLATRAAAKLLKTCASVSIVDMREDPAAIDFSQALAERHSGDAVVDFMRARLQAVTPQPKANGKAVAHADPSGSAFAIWQSLGLDCNANGMPYPTLANCSVVLQHHRDLQGKIWYDSFRDKIYTSIDGKPREWRDADDRNVTVWVNQALKMEKANLRLVREAVLHCAFLDQRNSFQDWVRGLKWDGTERLNEWTIDCLGCEGTDHTRAAGRNWLISMIARGFSPGCKADHLIVLEGKSGRGKSSVLEILGGLGDEKGNDWYAAVATEFGSKAFIENIQGKVLVEIPDMTGFDKALHSKIISTLTLRVDPYRVPWDRYSSDHPRRSVFAATSESSAYLEYPDGRRRYWPLHCGEINTSLLHAMREQLFAEAYRAYQAGELWYVMPGSTSEEQLDRVTDDTWSRSIGEYCAQRDGEKLHSTDLLYHVGVELKDQNDGHKRRITKIMISLGWEQKVDKIQGRSVRMWRRST